MIKGVYNLAIEVLEKCSTSHGFHAAFPGYQGVWARDSVITSLGASLLGDKFRETFRQSLITLAKNQSKKGQIPNAIMFDVKPQKVDYKSIDSSLWFIIGHYLYKERYKDTSLFRKFKKNIDNAVTWLSYQDMGEDHMLEQLPTTDWQDAFPHRYGHTINTQALWHKVLRLAGNNNEANALKRMVNDSKEDGLWNGNFYLPWRWKNHNKYQEKGEWFDSLGNLLAIIFDLADEKKAEKILEYIKKKRIHRPFPVKCIFPPIRKGTKDWQDYFNDAGARIPYHYSNAGIWTFIGGFYVLALLKLGKYEEANEQMYNLAQANIKDGSTFTEWLNGKTGKVGDFATGIRLGNQAWNAGMFILAYESMKKGKCLI